MYWFNKAVWFLSNPMTVGLVLLLLALLSQKFRRIGLLVVPILFYVLSCGWCGRIIGGVLERDYPQRSPESCPSADLIIELGGGMMYKENNRMGFPELASGADRVYYTALLWKANKAPTILTTSIGVEKTDNVFLRDLGVPERVIISDTASTTTEENAKFTLRLMKEQGFCSEGRRPKALLVTSAWHMKRSLYMFEKYAPEIECIPAACDYEVKTKGPLNFKDFIPDPSAFELSCRFLHEWLGILGYHFRR